MAYITECESKKEMFEYIKNRLDRRGLRIAYREEWEVHGPHRSMDYQVFVGFVRYKRGVARRQAVIDKRPFEVAVYPKRVYVIDLNEWSRVDSGDSIEVLKNYKIGGG